MPQLSYELPALALISAGYLISYFVGGRRKHQLLMSYSRTIHDEMSRVSQVGFRPFGHAGVRIRCSMKDKSYDYNVIEMALTMASRENLLHYPIALMTRDRDKLAFWGFTNKPINYTMEIVPLRQIRTRRKLEFGRGLQRLTTDDPSISKDFEVFTNDRHMAHKLLSSRELVEGFSSLGRFIKHLSIDSVSSRIYLLSEIRESNVKELLGFVLGLGSAFSKTLG